MRWPWRRAKVAAPAAAAFDASIDVVLRDVRREDREAVLEAVRQLVGELPGAGWISVEPHATMSVRLFAVGAAEEVEGGAWEAVRLAVAGAVREALAEARPSAGWATPAPARMGFAEAVAPADFAALEQLAQLANTTRKVRAKPRADPPAPIVARTVEPAVAPVVAPVEPESDEDILRLTRLLALVLPADKTEAARETAQAAVRRFGSFAGTLAAPEAELRLVPGLGTHCVAAVKLIHAAAVRLARDGIAGRPVLDDPKRLADYLAAALARERIEQFRILFLDEQGMLKADEVQARGTVNHTPVYPREVVRRALALGASSLILVHNHPSGDPEPSREDIEMTKQVAQAAAVMKIGLRDHVIIGNGRWLSFREQGLIR